MQDTDHVIAVYRVEIPHTRILTPTLERSLFRVDRRALEAAMVDRRVH